MFALTTGRTTNSNAFRPIAAKQLGLFQNGLISFAHQMGDAKPRFGWPQAG